GDLNAAAAFIQVNSPTTVVQPGDIVPQIVDDPRARLHAECIYPSHIAQDWPVPIRFDADVMHTVEGDLIVCGHRWPVAPCPANRNSGVEKVVNMIMQD